MKKRLDYTDVSDFSIDYNSIGFDDILDIHKYLMKKHEKILFDFIKKMFIELLSASSKRRFGESLAPNSKGRKKCISLNNQLCQAIRPTLLDINSN